MSIGNIKTNVSGDKVRPVRGADNLPPCMSWLSRQGGILNILEPDRLPRPVTGKAFFTLPFFSLGLPKCYRCVGLTTLQPRSRFSRQCGIVNISQPYRPPRPVTGIALLFLKHPGSFVIVTFIETFSLRRSQTSSLNSPTLTIRDYNSTLIEKRPDSSMCKISLDDSNKRSRLN
jgi:hypothetical protein